MRLIGIYCWQFNVCLSCALVCDEIFADILPYVCKFLRHMIIGGCMHFNVELDVSISNQVCFLVR